MFVFTDKGVPQVVSFSGRLSPIHILNDFEHNAKPNKNSEERNKYLITKLRSKDIVYLKDELTLPAHVLSHVKICMCFIYTYIATHILAYICDAHMQIYMYVCLLLSLDLLVQ